MIDLTVEKRTVERNAKRARERNVLIPTLAQQIAPETAPAKIRERLKGIGLWDVDPANLFRISWHNAPAVRGGGFGPVNYIEFPPSITGVQARIVAIVGKWFPTGAHKVGPAFGCLVPRLVSGQFDPTRQKAVWPSTGNYCRGGAYNSALLGCESVAILPEGMSAERFEWLRTMAGEVIKTPGSESNVKEIFDKCNELRKTGTDLMIFDQFQEMGNYLWHYAVTGRALDEVVRRTMGAGDSFAGFVSHTGSAGTIAAGDYLKQQYPYSKIVASEALQCPTLIQNGFGAHRIEGIGDKHVPWIHNIRNTDMVMAVDDDAAMAVTRLFNEPAGQQLLAEKGVPEALVARLPELGISCVANLLASIQFAKWYEMGTNDVVATVLTDSMELYQSRLRELTEQHGQFDDRAAVAAYERHLLGAHTANVQELTYPERKRVHNLKYFTWVEQQGKETAELNAQWEQASFWTGVQGQMAAMDALIDEFNGRSGMSAN
jgi:cysteine synthase